MLNSKFFQDSTRVIQGLVYESMHRNGMKKEKGEHSKVLDVLLFLVVYLLSIMCQEIT